MPNRNISRLARLGDAFELRSNLMASRQSSFDKFLQFFSSLKCGLSLLGLLGIAMILGTFILQRPMAQEGQIEQVYAPQVVRLLNALGLFDVFHAWWFILLLGLLGANITLASIERFPQVWRLYARPHFLADAAFIRALPFQREIPLGPHTPRGSDGARPRRSLTNLGYPPRPDILPKGTLYVEKHRLVRLAPYVVHASLLIIFAGAILDGTHGYKGYVSLRPGASTDVIEPLTVPGAHHHLDFTLRCDAAGMDPYPDGSPRQYWSQLTVLENGREVEQKKIYVNDPLTYKGVRFFQAYATVPSGRPAQACHGSELAGKRRGEAPGADLGSGDARAAGRAGRCRRAGRFHSRLRLAGQPDHLAVGRAAQSRHSPASGAARQPA